jgi:hypothetical protein
LSKDPRLLNPAQFDFHLTEGSPVRATGTDTGLKVDLEGIARRPSEIDIGALQYSALSAEKR